MTKFFNHYLDEETVSPNELLPQNQWASIEVAKNLYKNVCNATQETQKRKEKKRIMSPYFSDHRMYSVQ